MMSPRAARPEPLFGFARRSALRSSLLADTAAPLLCLSEPTALVGAIEAPQGGRGGRMGVALGPARRGAPASRPRRRSPLASVARHRMPVSAENPPPATSITSAHPPEFRRAPVFGAAPHRDLVALTGRNVGINSTHLGSRAPPPGSRGRAPIGLVPTRRAPASFAGRNTAGADSDMSERGSCGGDFVPRTGVYAARESGWVRLS
jgi:hypothetical protein